MKVGNNQWLEGVERRALPGGLPMTIRRCLVIHFTSGASGVSSIEDYWKTPAAKGACAHLVIERDGTIIQCRPFDRTCGHAGVSRWRDPRTGTLYVGANAYAIGIELANAGSSDGALSWARKQPGFRSIHARHSNGGPVQEWEAYPAAQLAACTAVAKVLVARYQLDDITGHDCIAPERKDDPGPAFPMADLRAACGFAGLPAVHRK
jgi:N-acetylmuramoyl-L-alanine amidase